MEDKDRMKKTNIALTLKQDKELELLAYAYGNISKANLIRIAIAEYISNHRYLLEDLKK
ncbi:MAG: ribbon-helix-helix protein, CopG family [Methanobacterium sp.]